MNLENMLEQTTALVTERRPSASQTTIKTYSSLLVALGKRLLAEGNEIVDFNNHEMVLKHIRENDKLGDAAKRTLLASLLVVSDAAEYKAEMKTHSKRIIAEMKERRWSDKRKDHVPSIEFIKGKYDEYLAKLDKNPTHQNYMNCIITAVTSTRLIEPRRGMDWTEMKIRNFDINTDNCVVGTSEMKFVFNRFKNSKSVAPELKVMDVPPELSIIINRWKMVNDNDYLIYGELTGKPYNSSGFARKLNTIYGKRVSIDMIRSVVWSHELKTSESLQGYERKADEMAHSLVSALIYYAKKS